MITGPSPKQMRKDDVDLHAQVDACNKETEAKEIAWLKTGPDKVFLYVKMPPNTHPNLAVRHFNPDENCTPRITTWVGTSIASQVEIGPRKLIGFQGHSGSYRRSVSCYIFGRRYTGWYFESSGDYCRLKLAKKQL